jgi:hypothetical protein
MHGERRRRRRRRAWGEEEEEEACIDGVLRVQTECVLYRMCSLRNRKEDTRVRKRRGLKK